MKAPESYATPLAEPNFPRVLSPEELETHVFVVPETKIKNHRDLKMFLCSDSAKEFFAFVLFLNEAVSGLSLGECSSNMAPSPAIGSLLSILIEIDSWIREIQPVKENVRFGNPAFRIWQEKLADESTSLLERILPENMPQREAIRTELNGYFIQSFGNSSRIDYGTGHETTFVAFLFCLAKIGVCRQEDAKQLVALVFKQYLNLVRNLQKQYRLEPAGTHGVWGLDDYQILPFLWGSSQLVRHPLIQPSSIHSNDVLEEYYEDYLYLSCIRFVKGLKTGAFHETSPMLYDISGLSTWDQINKGMVKLYKGELLHKLPIMQHFAFGSILSFEVTQANNNDLGSNTNKSIETSVITN